jgi:5'-nucleotidase
LKKKYFIIISNDDGIQSAGLKALYDALIPIADILVAAPDSQRSGASHSISIANPIKTVNVKYWKSKAYAISGTPADCAKLSILKLALRNPDLFISGINHGPNIAQFILYSGTVGAAAEAAMLGVPSMAFSIDAYEPQNFDFAVKYIQKIALKVLTGKIKFRRHSLLNINLPDKTESGIKGVKILPKGRNEYKEKYIRKISTKNGINYYWQIVGRQRKKNGKMTDADGVEAGFITITPLDFDLNDRESKARLKPGSFRI